MTWRHGTTYSYADKGCRCQTCMAGMRAFRAATRSGQRSRPTPDHVHGTANGYQNYGCRCDDCRHAQAIAIAQYRAAKAEVTA